MQASKQQKLPKFCLGLYKFSIIGDSSGLFVSEMLIFVDTVFQT